MHAETAVPKKKENLTYVFHGGDTVILKQFPETSPKMIVKEKVMEPKPHGHGKRLKAVICYWVDNDGNYQEKEFEFLNLEVVKRAIEGMPLK